MKMFYRLAAVAAGILTATAANASPIVDGTLDPSYGGAKSTVIYDPAAPESNFGTPTNMSDAIGYQIYLTSDANYVYGFLQASGPGASVGAFANLYFDIDPQNNNGSDIGFEITNDRGFIAGGSGYSDPLGGLTFATNGNNALEFAIANSYFTSAMPGLTYDPSQAFATNGSTVTLRLSQAFGYSVAGGATYGNDRLGSVVIGGAATGAVPEPATWAMMLLGFGLIGGALRRGMKQSDVRFNQRIRLIEKGELA